MNGRMPVGKRAVILPLRPADDTHNRHHDRTRRPDPSAQVTALLQYVDGELLCYRADHPALLCARQKAEWDPQLAWLQARYGIAMAVTQGIMPLSQSQAYRWHGRAYWTKWITPRLRHWA